ncbi:MAG: hypothetical protein CL920_16895 [Deltaproteobacteria bacterium]|nr:hypothetical protein [Deltaproteobacteria bacterium]MBU50358.1 hypothetical protein [Deltaproteobacteria bacterium]
MGMQGCRYQLSSQGYVFLLCGNNAIACIREDGSFETTSYLGPLEEEQLKKLCADILFDLHKCISPSTRFLSFQTRYENWATDGLGCQQHRGPFVVRRPSKQRQEVPLFTGQSTLWDGLY